MSKERLKVITRYQNNEKGILDSSTIQDFKISKESLDHYLEDWTKDDVFKIFEDSNELQVTIISNLGEPEEMKYKVSLDEFFWYSQFFIGYCPLECRLCDQDLHNARIETSMIEDSKTFKTIFWEEKDQLYHKKVPKETYTFFRKYFQCENKAVIDKTRCIKCASLEQTCYF